MRNGVPRHSAPASSPSEGPPLKTLLYVLLALLALLVATVLVAPSFVDWNAYKAEIAERARRAIGRDLAIGGDVELSMLPRPTLSVRDVTVANAAGGRAEAIVALEALHVEVRIPPLLQGRIEIREVSLERPEIVVERLPDGRWNWQAAGAGAGPRAGDGVLGGFGADIKLDELRIEDGRLVYRDMVSGVEQRLSAVDARISAESLVGPLSGRGSFAAQGVRSDFELSLGRFDGGGAVPVNVQLALRDRAARAELNGALDPDAADGGPLLSGDLEAAGDDLGGLLAAFGLGGGRAPQLAQPFALSGTLAAGRARTGVRELSVELGETSADGTFALEYGEPPRASLDLSVQHLDLDRLLAMPAPSGKRAAAGEGRFGLPGGMRAEVNLDIGAVVYRGQVIRQGRVNAVLADGAVTLNQAMALLPGGGDAALFGTLTARDGMPVFDGRIEAASDNLRAMLDWLGVVAERVPPDRLRRMSLLADVRADGRQITLTGIDLQVDTTAIHGAAAVALGRGRPGLGIGLRVETLNVDAYWPRRDGVAGDAEAGGGGSALPGFLGAFDANLDLRARRVLYRDRAFEDVRFDATLNKGALTVREARIGAFAGSRLALSGTLSGFLTATPSFDGELDLAVREPVTFARLFDAAGRVPPDLGEVALTGSFKGRPEQVDLDVELRALNAAARAEGRLRPLAGPPSFEGRLKLRHPDLAALLREGTAAPPAPGELGGLDLSGRVSATPAALRVSELEGRIGPVAVSGTLDGAFDGPRPVVRASLETGAVPVRAFGVVLPAGAANDAARGGAGGAGRWSDTPVQLGALRALDGELTLRADSIAFDEGMALKAANVHAALNDGVLDVDRFAGKLFGGQVDLVGTVDARSEPTVGARLTARDLDAAAVLGRVGSLPGVSGTLDLEAELTGQGRSERALVESLSGQGTIAGALTVPSALAEGVLRDVVGGSLGQVQSVEAAAAALLQGFADAPARLSGGFAARRGTLSSDDLTLAGEDARARLRGSIDLANWRTDAALDLHAEAEDGGEPALTVRLRGTLDRPNIALRGGPVRARPQELEEPESRPARDTPPRDSAGTAGAPRAPEEGEPAQEPGPEEDSPGDAATPGEDTAEAPPEPAPPVADDANEGASGEQAPPATATSEGEAAPEPDKKRSAEDIIRGLLEGQDAAPDEAEP